MTFAFLLVAALVAGALSASAVSPGDVPAVYTNDADFDLGTLVNVNHDTPGQLQLNDAPRLFGFIWVVATWRDTVIKIDTETGAILGEFRTTPSTQTLGIPKRTTVDNDGSVWIANQAMDSTGHGLIVHVGLEENGQCEDRDNSGSIDTSTGLGDIKAWTDASGTRGVATAADECIVHYTQVNSQGTLHVSVNANNDVWVGGLSSKNFDLVKGGRFDVANSGTIIRSETSVGFGGSGGLIDGNGVIWSAGPLLRWDTANPLTGGNGDPAGPSIGPAAPGTNWSGQDGDSFGLCIDPFGNVWNTHTFGDVIHKYAPDGAHLGVFSHGDNAAMGCASEANGDIWVAHSIFGATTVGHLRNDGTFVGNVSLVGGVGPTGVAVDAAGKVWVTNYESSSVSRIDPSIGMAGAVDLTVDLGGELGDEARPINYGDMTGSILMARPNTGTWTVTHDSGVTDAVWSTVSWTAEEPGDSSIVVTAASSGDGVTFGPEVPVTSGASLGVATGQYLKVTVTFDRATTGESPALYDITLVHNRPPIADPNGPYLFPLEAGPFDGSGSSDPDGDSLTYAWDSGDGNMGSGEFANHTYAEAGIYDVCLTVNDGVVDSAEVCTTAVIYDPDGGFVTGGGWIYSDAGDYLPDPTAEGKATFGFVSKYKKGASVPTGNTEFQFHAGDLNFHPSSYDWLVVTGSNFAKFKGEGTINGEGAYKFQIWAGDNDPDTFRIKIWTEVGGVETVIYDNGMNQPINAGSIIVHTKKQ